MSRKNITAMDGFSLKAPQIKVNGGVIPKSPITTGKRTAPESTGSKKKG